MFHVFVFPHHQRQRLRCHPSGLRNFIRSLQDPTTTRINIPLTNLWNSMMDPSSITFEDVVVSWYSNLLLHGHSAIDTTGIENKIFQAFSVPLHALYIIFTNTYVHVLCLPTYPCILFYTFPPPFDKNHRWLLQSNSADTGNRDMQAQLTFESQFTVFWRLNQNGSKW